MNKLKNNYHDNVVLIDDNMSNSQLSSHFSSLPSANVTNKKDERLELIEISKGLIEILQKIDDYIGEIIHRETKKMDNNMKFSFFIN
jgi:hypothetical protein